MVARVALLLVLIALAGGTASAQIVNVQGALAKAPAADGASGDVALKVTWRSGNNPLFDVGGAGTVLVRHGRVLALALARGEYGRSGGVTLTEKSFEHLRARVTIDCRWRWEVFLQHEFDKFLVLVGAVAGGGARDQPELSLLAGAAYLLDFERLDDRMGTLDAGREDVSSRASLYLTGHEDLSTSVSIIETVYVQPRLTDPSDVRLLGELSVQSKLTKHTALKDSFVIAYDDTPPEGVKRLDTALEVALLVSF
ncbi:MAG: DUF481 domain-containing protein [Myxococcales bacterium]|nr:DUF481 domain-containing protein [Myxococcales bacterium]